MLVTAPTGSGKTWSAREENRRLIERGWRAWYTSPLKALTNSKYQEFSDEFGAERVGILTGDRKENSDAPLVVGTTEIYRNQLFDSLRGGSEVAADLVVIDEALPRRRRPWSRLGRSTYFDAATNSVALVVGDDWKRHRVFVVARRSQGVECTVISGPPLRPVALRSAVLLPDKRLLPLLNEHGKLNPELLR